MKVLLDECVHEDLRHHFPGHECQTAKYAGFTGLENGELLREAEAAEFQVLITVDRGFEYQQNIGGRQISLIVFCGKSVLLEDLLPLMQKCLETLETIRPGQVVRLGNWLSAVSAFAGQIRVLRVCLNLEEPQ